MAIISGGQIGPNGVGGAYENTIETDRTATWYGHGGYQGILKGFVHSGVPGQMALSFTKGAALVSERDAIGGWTDRGYTVYADTDTTVTFGPASIADRNDALVAAVVDTEDGPVGTGALDVGPHLVVVPGVSGTTTPRTSGDITAYLGRGGWMRILDVPIASTDTQINVANIVVAPNLQLRAPNTIGVTASAGWSVTSAQYTRNNQLIDLYITGTRTGVQIAGGVNGNVSPDSEILTGIPAGLIPVMGARYLKFVRNGVTAGTARLNQSGSIELTDVYPESTVTAPGAYTVEGVYSVAV